MRTATITSAAILLAAVLAGCPKYTKPVPRTRELTTPERNFEALWNASLRVLREYRFTLALQDRRAGIIETQPMVSQHFTEFWRQEASTPGDVLESSLHTIYRSVIIKLVPVERGADKYRAIVQVNVARSNLREPHVTSVSQAYDLFSQTSRKQLKVEYGEDSDEVAEKPGEVEAASIVPLGRDSKLEAILAGEISTASGFPATRE